MKRFALILFVAQSLCAFGAPKSNAARIEDLKMRKRFGVGVSAAGPLSMLGIEFDVNLSEEFSLSGGIGTGLDYNTTMLKGRYFLLGEWVSPYLALGVARWWTRGTKGTDVTPSVLANRFLEPGQDPRRGFDIVMLTPAMGVQFLHPMGLAVFAEIYYLFKLVDFSNGTYAGMGLHWYF
jgi:hypothetical protein